MSHIEIEHLHAYANRGLDIRVAVATDEEHTDFTAITFRIAETAIEKTGLTADDTVTGFDTDLTLTAAELSITPDVYRWELVATLAGQVRTVAHGRFTVSEEITS